MEAKEPQHATNTGQERTSDPCVMVIFGASGDLTKRKLIPALYNLAREHFLSREFAVVGIARRPMTHDTFREKVMEEIHDGGDGQSEAALREWLTQRLYYLAGNLQDAATYQRLQQMLTQIDHDHGTRGNYFFYLATAPEFFSTTVQQLGAAGLTQEDAGHW